MDELNIRATMRSGNPIKIAKAIDAWVAGSVLESPSQHVLGDHERSVSYKRKKDTPLASLSGSWRSDMDIKTLPRPARPPTLHTSRNARQLFREAQGHTSELVARPPSLQRQVVFQYGKPVLKRDLPNAIWHIERTLRGSKVRSCAVTVIKMVKCTSLINCVTEEALAPILKRSFRPFRQVEAKNKKF